MNQPKITDAPGHRWRRLSDKWECRWQARTDLIKKGFTPKSRRLWEGIEPTELEVAQIQDACRRLQDEMLIFGRGGLPEPKQHSYVYDGTYKSLINCFQTDPDSRYHRKRYSVRKNHDTLLRRILERHGHELVKDTKGRTLLARHEMWSDEGRMLSTAAAIRGQFRSLYTFGATILEDPECERLCTVMSRMRFDNPAPRKSHLSSAQADAVRAKAHEWGLPSIALGQALQFEITLRQRDVIGELVPLEEPGTSDVIWEGKKWLRGLRWSEVDQNFILEHVTSKKGKTIVADLRLAPMVQAELAAIAEVPASELQRDMFPTTGPIIKREATGMPWSANAYRKQWRKIADAAGVPKDVWNMDSRSGAITEATDAGAELEDVRHAATHSDIAMTQRYSRGSAEKVAKVMRLRVAHRNKPAED
jgi:hypothetical protein